MLFLENTSNRDFLLRFVGFWCDVDWSLAQGTLGRGRCLFDVSVRLLRHLVGDTLDATWRFWLDESDFGFGLVSTVFTRHVEKYVMLEIVLV